MKPATPEWSPEKHRLLELMRQRKTGQIPATQPFQLIDPADRAQMPEDLEDAYPLGGVQLGMLFHMQLASTGHKPAAYHNVSTFQIRFRQPFVLEPFQEAVNAAVARHAIYRTRFDLDHFSEPLQLVQRSADLRVSYQNLSGLDKTEAESLLNGFIHEENQRAIAIDHAPLLRLHVHRHGPDLISLSLTEPHSIADGWSTHLTLVEIFGHYLARIKGLPVPEAKPLAVAYRDFIQLERQTIQSRSTQEFWAAKLGAVVPCEPRGWDRTNSGQPAYGDHKLHHDLPHAKVEALRTWCQRQGFPLKSLFLAIHLKVLSLLTGQQRITTGLVFNGRPEVPDGDRVPGLFLNTLPLSLCLCEGSWSDLVRQAYEAESEILPHRRYPLSLLQAQRRERLFDTAFCFLHFHSVQDLAASQELEVLHTTDLSLTNFELMVIVRANPADPNGVRLVLQSHLERLDKRQLAWMRDYFLEVINAVIDDLNRPAPVAHHLQNLIPAPERSMILDRFSQSLSHQETLPQLIALAAPSLAAVLSGPQLAQVRVYLLDRHLLPVALGVCAKIHLISPSFAAFPAAQAGIASSEPDPCMLAMERRGYFTPEGMLILDEKEKKCDLAWWRNYLQGASPYLTMPLHPTPRPSLNLQKPLCIELHLEVSRDRALALLVGLLQRYGSQDGLVIGVADPAGRVWPLCLAPPRTATLAQVIEEIDAHQAQIALHRTITVDDSYELLHQGVAPRPVLTVSFNAGPPSLHAGERIAHFAWHHELTTHGTRLTLLFKGAPYDRGQVQRFAHHYERMLTGTTESAPLIAVDLLDTEERRLLLEIWSGSQSVEKGPWIHFLIESQAAKSPEEIAVRFEGLDLTYCELAHRARRLAADLRARGIGLEVPVGVCAERSLELVIALVGILMAGGYYLPLPPDYPQERLGSMIEQAGAKLILAETPHSALLARCGAEILDLKSLCNAGEVHTDLVAPKFEGDHTAYLIFTSGSTGTPKGVTCGHLGMRQRIVWLYERFPLGQDDHVLQKTSFGFDVSVWEFFWPLSCGARLVMAKPGGQGDPEYLKGVIEQERISVLHFVPSMLSAFLDVVERGHCASLKWVFCSGEALTTSLQTRFFQRFPTSDGVATLHNFYGLTETAVDMSYWHCRDDRELGTVPIGAPFAGMRWYLLDPELRPVALGLIGELFIGGAGLARCYCARPGLTAQRFVPDPFSQKPGERLYRSGDLARYYPNGHAYFGHVEFLGRSDHQIKLRGYRIELGEIESELIKIPSIREAVVLARPDRNGDLCLVAYLRLADDAPFDSSGVQATMAAHLPRFMIPAHFIPVERFPVTTSGKLDHRALPGVEAKTQNLEQAPERAVEARLVEIWAETLKLSGVGLRDNFFDLGGHSLSILEVRRLIKLRLHRSVSLVDLFQYPTIAALGQYLEPRPLPVPQPNAITASNRRVEIAVVSMAGRFPGAPDLEQFWANLEAGKVSITTLGDDQLPREHLESGLANQHNYVRSKGLLAGIDAFDADFFRMPPREAQVTDPQHRLFLEVAWQALEQAGLNPRQTGGRVGVFAGAALATYGYSNVMTHPDLIQELGQQFFIANDAAYLATKVAYKLGLTGPALNVQTACSTGLVAIALACRALMSGECELALAGSVAVSPKQNSGYLYKQGGITSRDGLCRPFDASANGTVPGHGLGIVLLEPLARAIEQGHPVQAIVTGFALNNDGDDKAGFTAPSVSGQACVIGAALAMANVRPESVDYIETHGTGTLLGDPIEVAALKLAYSDARFEQPYCALGSVKANIGHLDTAAGVAGFIKVVLALQHGKIPGNPHFERANPELGLEGSPFYIERQTQNWPSTGPRPRRAAVSSFGIGGTNAHVILEQAPPRSESEAAPGPMLFPVSARSELSLRQLVSALVTYLEKHPDLSPADVAYTLQVGRLSFAHRCFVLANSLTQTCARLRQWLAQSRVDLVIPDAHRRLLELGQTWLGGNEVDWQALHSTARRHRLALPGVIFERQRYWIDPAPASPGISGVPKQATTKLGPCFLPGWKQAWMPTPAKLEETETWLVFANSSSLCQAVLERLALAKQNLVQVFVGESFQIRTEREFSIASNSLEDYQLLGDELAKSHLQPNHILHFWNLGPASPGRERNEPFYEMLHLAQSLIARFQGRGLALNLVADCVFAVESTDAIEPAKSLLLGPAKVIPREFSRVVCRFADVCQPTHAAAVNRLADALLGDWARSHGNAARFTAISAYRGTKRWVLDYSAADLPTKDPRLCLKDRGCYLITGGLGGIGMALADYLAQNFRARLILTSRGHKATEPDGPIERGLSQAAQLRELEVAGAEVMLASVDVTDRSAMAHLLDRAERRFGKLNGVIHAAGVAGGGVISLATRTSTEQVMSAKTEGTEILAELLAERSLDFVVLCSSVASILGGPGQVDYCAANAYLDAFAQARAQQGAPWISMNWDSWREVGMAVRAASVRDSHSQARLENLHQGLTTEQAVLAFVQVLGLGQAQVVVSARDFAAMTDLAASIRHSTETERTSFRQIQRFPRPHLAAEFCAASSAAERAIAAIWEEMIGLLRVGIDDNFFELGGDSLLGLQIVDRINRELGVSLTAAGLYEAPTVRAVAQLTSSENLEPARRLETSQERGSNRKDKIRSKRKSLRSSAYE